MRGIIVAAACSAMALCLPTQAVPALRASTAAVCSGTPDVSGHVSCPLGAAVSSGDAIVACAMSGNHYDVTALSDGVNGSYTLGTQQQTDSSQRIRCGWFINSASGTPTVQVTYNNVTNTAWLHVAAFSGVKTTGSAISETGISFPGGSSDPVTCANASATAANQLLVAALVLDSAASGIAPNNGETELTEGSSHLTQMEYKLTAGSGNIAATWDLNTALPPACAEVILDAATAAGSFSAGPTAVGASTTTFTVTFTATAAATVKCGAWLYGTVPSAADVNAGTNAHGTTSVAATGSSQNQTLTVTDGTTAPVYDIYCTADGGATKTSVVRTFLVPATGKQFVTLGSVNSTGSVPKAFNDAAYKSVGYDTQTANFTVNGFFRDTTSGAYGFILKDTDGGATGTLILDVRSGSLADNDVLTDNFGGAALVNGTPSTVAAIAPGDVLVVPTTVSPSSASLTVDSSGQYGFTASGRQSALGGQVYDVSAQAYFDSALNLDVWLNNSAPTCAQAQTPAFANGSVISYGISDLCSDADTDTLAYALATGTKPSGTSFNATTGVLSGTVTVNGTSSLGFVAYDTTYALGDLSVTLTVSSLAVVPDCTTAPLQSNACVTQIGVNTSRLAAVTDTPQCSSAVSPGYVIATSPKKNTTIVANAAVGVTYSTGACAQPPIPMVNCLSQTVSACQTLVTAAFASSVTLVSAARSCPVGYASGKIIAQSPARGTPTTTPATLTVSYCN